MYMPESPMCRKVQTQLLLTLSKQKTEQGMLWHWKSDLSAALGSKIFRSLSNSSGLHFLWKEMCGELRLQTWNCFPHSLEQLLPPNPSGFGADLGTSPTLLPGARSGGRCNNPSFCDQLCQSQSWRLGRASLNPYVPESTCGNKYSCSC